MEKTKENKGRVHPETVEKEWVDIPETLKRRTTASGATFGGMYVPKKK